MATLAGDTIADLEALLAELGGIDAGDIVATRLLALAALQTGWNADPTFQLWTLGAAREVERRRALPHMARSSPASTAAASRSTSAPARSRSRVRAARTWPGRCGAADPEAEWLVLSALVTFTSGSGDALRSAPSGRERLGHLDRRRHVGADGAGRQLAQLGISAPGRACSRASRCW